MCPRDCDGETDILDEASTKPHADMSRISASQSHVVTSGTSGLMAPIAPGSVVITSQTPNIVQQVRDEVADAIRRQGGTAA